MKSTLSENEIMDLVEDIEMIINRACREKRRRMPASENQPPPPPPMVPSMSTDNNNIYTGPGPQGPMAHVVQHPEELQVRNG